MTVKLEFPNIEIRFVGHIHPSSIDFSTNYKANPNLNDTERETNAIAFVRISFNSKHQTYIIQNI